MDTKDYILSHSLLYIILGESKTMVTESRSEVSRTQWEAERIDCKEKWRTFIKDGGDFQCCDCSSSYITTYLSRLKKSCRFKMDGFLLYQRKR